MKTAFHRFFLATQMAAFAVAILTVCGPNAACAQETEAPDRAETRAADSKSEQDSAVKIHKASCRCGQLSATYKGPDPERITLCHCNSCQLRTGTAFSIQARLPRQHVKINGKSTEWTFPDDLEKKPDYRSCDSGGATFHFCPTCGSTVYWDIHAAPEVVGIAIGTLTDPTFPAPKISGFEAYAHPWAMKPADLPILRAEHDKLK